MITRRDFMKAGAVILTGAQAAENATQGAGPTDGPSASAAAPQEEKNGSGWTARWIWPSMGGLDSFEGKAPTPHSDVHVKYERQKSDNQTDIYVTVPQAAKATLWLPYSRRQPIVTLNNQPWFSGGRFQPNPLVANPRAADDCLELEMQSGNYYFRVGSSLQKPEL